MAARPERIGTVLALTALACCAGADPFLSVGEGVDGPAFLVVVRGGSVVRVESLGSNGQAGQKLPLGDDDSEAFWIGVETKTILELAPGYPPERSGEVTLLSDPTKEPSSSRFDDPMLLRLPASTKVFHFEADTGRTEPTTVGPHSVLSSLLLSVPSDPEFCNPDPTLRLEPFGARALLFPIPGISDPSPGFEEELRDVVLLGPDRLVGLSPAAIFLLERGGTIQPVRPGGPSPTLPVSALRPLYELFRLAVDPRQSSDGSTRLLAVGAAVTGGGAIVELSVTEAGLRTTGTATVAEELGDPTQLRSIAVAPDGTVVVVGRGGWVLARAPGATVFQRATDPATLSGLDVLDVLATERSEAPHLLGLDGFHIAEGDAGTGRWSVIEVAGETVAASTRIWAGLGMAPDGELWAAGSQGSLARSKTPGVWELLEVDLPPSLGACGLERGTLFDARANLSAVGVGERYAYLAMRPCDAVIRVDRERLCASPLLRQGQDEPTGAELFTRVRRVSGRIFALSGSAGIFVLPEGAGD